MIEAQQHQGQHREHAAARGGPARHRARAGRGRRTRRSPASAAPPAEPQDHHGDVLDAGACSWSRADSPDARIADLRGKPVAFGAQGSGLVILARYVLDGIGLDQTTDFQAIFLERAGDGPAMVLDGRAAALWGGGIGWPGLHDDDAAARRARASSRRRRTRSTRILAKHAFLKRLTLPAGELSRARRRRSRRSARGASSSRARRSTTRSPTASRARCTGAKRRSRRACRRPARPPPPTPPPPSPRPTSSTPASRAICARSGRCVDPLSPLAGRGGT